MEDKIVYVLMEDNGLCWEDYDEEIIGIFNNYKQAEQVKKFMEEKRKDYNYNIIEYELNTFEYGLDKFKINLKNFIKKY